MGLNYEKIQKKKQSDQNQWASYSDLFMLLSVVFLFLYVVNVLRLNSHNLSAQVKLQQTSTELSQAQEKLNVYNVLNKNYADIGPSKKEQEVYSKLLNHLNLLNDSTQSSLSEAVKKYKELDQKSQQVQHYKELIKNIITANQMAQSNLSEKDTLIKEKLNTINQLKKKNSKTKSNLNKTLQNLSQKEKLLADTLLLSQKKEEKLKRSLNSKESQLEQLKNIHDKFEKNLVTTQNELERKEIRLDKVTQKKNEIKQELDSKNIKLEQLRSETEYLKSQKKNILDRLELEKKNYQSQIDQLQKDHEDNVKNQKLAFNQKMRNLQLTNAARIKKEIIFQNDLKRENFSHQKKINLLKNRLSDTKSSIAEKENYYQNKMAALKEKNTDLKKNIARSLKKLNDRKELARILQNNFRRAGVDAKVDKKSGDLTIDFGKHYFATGSAQLTSGMRKILNRVIPVYTTSLFQDSRISQNIETVELVGFASPTYRGRYVNPDDLGPEARKAVTYNMDLSYQRARSIFDNIFNTRQMKFNYQKKLLKLTKVAGRSYLSSERIRQPSSYMSYSEYCRRYNCQSHQKVLIKFKFKN